MNDLEIRNAIGVRLTSDSMMPKVVAQNKSYMASLPYVSVSFVPTGNIDRTLAGTVTEFFGFMLASVVSDKDQYELPGLEIAQRIVALFPTAMILSTLSGIVKINKPCDLLPGYSDGVNWRTPVKVYYHAT